MLQHLRPAILLTVLFTVLTGLIYPLTMTGVAGIVARGQASGSLMMKDGIIVGSALIGQHFSDPRYFHPRPSATSAGDPEDASKTIDAPYNAANSSGSNLGPTSLKLVDRVKSSVDTLRQSGIDVPVPGDAVTTSGSGLDPHVSPETAFRQASRVAEMRSLSLERVKSLIEQNLEGRLLGFIGEPRVNILRLNLALDSLPAS